MPRYVASYSDRYVNSYYEFRRKRDEYEMRLLKIVTNIIQKHTDPKLTYRLLDVGSGLGSSHKYLLEKFSNVHISGVEIVPLSVLTAQKNNPTRAEYHQGDGCHLPFPENSFDIIFSQNAVEHAGLPLIQEMFRVQKPQGFSLLIGPSYIGNLTGAPWKILKFLIFQKPHIHGYKVSTYLNLIKDAGFQIKSHDAISFNSIQRIILQPWALNPKWSLPPKWLVDFVFLFNALMENFLKALNWKAWLWIQIFELKK